MSFYLTKLAWILLKPSYLWLILVVLGSLLTVSRFRRLGLGLLITAFTALLIGGFFRLDLAMLSTLEDRFPLPSHRQIAKAEGIIVLGGAMDRWVSRAHKQLNFNGGADRFIQAVMLAKQYPHLRVVLAMGTNWQLEDDARDVQMIRHLFTIFGVAPERVIVEDKARNTFETAAFTKKMIAVEPDQTWLLITSAWHMPRSVAVFRAANWPVLAYPVDYFSVPQRDILSTFHWVEVMGKTDIAFREFLGLAGYYLTGKTKELWPQP